MDADALSPFFARSSAALAFNRYDKPALLFPKGEHFSYLHDYMVETWKKIQIYFQVS